jgi:transposase
MAKPYPEELRRRVVETVEDGATIPETSEQHSVSISSVVRFLRLHRETGSVSPAQFGGYKDFALAEHEDKVRQWVTEQPDITLMELKAKLAKEKITVGKSSISRFLHHLGLPFKKKPASGRAGPARCCRRAQGVAAEAAEACSQAACIHR